MTNPSQNQRAQLLAALIIGFWKEARPPLFKMSVPLALPGLSFMECIIAQYLYNFNHFASFIFCNLVVNDKYSR